MHTTYAVTISPPHRLASGNYFLPYTMMFLDDALFIRQVMKFNRIGTYVFYPEFDKKLRLHYHGIITVDHNQKVRLYKHGIHKLKRLGHTDIKLLDSFIDNLRWILYIQKDWGTTKEILTLTDPIMKQEIVSTKHFKEILTPKTPNILDYFS